MKVSLNELQGLGRKAFAGIGFDEGDAIDAADMVAWMEAHDLGGLAALSKGLGYLLREDTTVTPTVIYQDADLCVLDAHGHSILGNASLAIELGYTKARARGLSVTKIRCCHNRLLVIGYLSRIAKRGMNVTAFWRNARHPTTEYVAGFRAGHIAPEFCAYSLDEPEPTAEPNDGIILVMADHVDLLPALRPERSLNNLLHRDESRLFDNRDRALAEGIEVEDALWQRLKQLADRLLVEATDTSRAGAGAGTQDND